MFSEYMRPGKSHHRSKMQSSRVDNLVRDGLMLDVLDLAAGFYTYTV